MKSEVAEDIADSLCNCVAADESDGAWLEDWLTDGDDVKLSTVLWDAVIEAYTVNVWAPLPDFDAEGDPLTDLDLIGVTVTEPQGDVVREPRGEELIL